MIKLAIVLIFAYFAFKIIWSVVSGLFNFSDYLIGSTNVVIRGIGVIFKATFILAIGLVVLMVVIWDLLFLILISDTAAI